MPTVGTTPFYNEIILSYTRFLGSLRTCRIHFLYERHNLSEYGLSLIHDFSLLQYNLQKYKIFVADLSQPKTKKRHNSLRFNLLCRY